MITKVGFPGGREYSFNGWLLMAITIVAVGLMVSLFVEAIPEANADSSKYHNHYCSDRPDLPDCVPDSKCVETEHSFGHRCPDTDPNSEENKAKKDSDEIEHDTRLDNKAQEIAEQKELIEQDKQDILDIKLESQEKMIEWNQEKQLIESSKQNYRNLIKDVSLKKSEIRNHTPATSGNFTAHQELRKQLNDEMHELEDLRDNAFTEWQQSIKDEKILKDEYWESVNAIQDAENKLKDDMLVLQDLQKEYRTLQRKTNLISIVLSGTCEQTIKRHWEATQLDPDHYNPSQCLTYRELIVFDNTIPAISGGFEDLGWDINRMKSGLQNIPEYYNQLPFWKVVAVDPDGETMTRSATITVSPSDISYLKSQTESDKTESLSLELMERYQFHDIMISEDCRKAIVSPKISAVTGALNYMMDNCTPDKSSWEIMSITKLFSIGGTLVDEYSQRYMDWVALQFNPIASSP